MSELAGWFEKRRKTKALTTIQQHLALTTSIVDLEKAVEAAIKKDAEEMQTCIERIASNKKEADFLLRKVMGEVSRGELTPTAREDIMHLVKRVYMVAYWSREFTRVLIAIPMEHVSASVKNAFVGMIKGIKECAFSLQKCVNKIMTKREEALQAADDVEREGEKVGDMHEKARMLLGTADLPKAGVDFLIGQLFEAMEMIADACEDTCDHVRVIIVRKG